MGAILAPAEDRPSPWIGSAILVSMWDGEGIWVMTPNQMPEEPKGLSNFPEHCQLPGSIE
jgi:hypothetical protein